MPKTKMTKKELEKLYEKSKSVSKNFKHTSEMLLVFPRSLRIIRYSVREGIRKFGDGCKIDYKNIRKIEVGDKRLGVKRINRILKHVENKKPNFSRKYIFDSYHELSKLGEKGFFAFHKTTDFVKISRTKRRETVIKMLKYLPMTNGEKEVYNLLKAHKIPFEKQAPINASRESIKMVVTDFAIPSSNDPKILIETSNGRIEYLKESDYLTQMGMGKLILGFRTKKFLPKTKLFLVLGNRTLDLIAKGLMLEAYDFIFDSNNVKHLPLKIKETLNA